MTYYHFATVKAARQAGLRGAKVDELIHQVTAHRQAVSAVRAKHKKTRKAARAARRAGRA